MRVAMVAVLLLSTAACQKPETKAVVPEVFRVKFQTSEGDFIVEASRAWAPRGADRFHELVNMVLRQNRSDCDGTTCATSMKAASSAW